MKVLVIAKEFPKYYNKELYVLWTSVTPNGKTFYHCSDKLNALWCEVYLGECQVKIIENQMIGIITKEGMVKISDTKYIRLPIRGIDKEGYPEALIDAIDVGGKGWFQRQSIKPFIGMKVEYDDYDNFKIIKE